MSENLHELCRAVVEEFYGNFHSRLFSQLAYHGRLSAPQLAQRCHLSLRHVKSGLSALIQSRLVYHHSIGDAPSTYQANLKAAYNILRIGQLVDLVQHEYGSTAKTILSEAFMLGYTTIAELEARSMHAASNNNPTVLNGSSPEDIGNNVQRNVRAMIKTLIDNGYLKHVRSTHFQTEYDAIQDAQIYLSSIGVVPSTKGKKGVAEMEEKATVEYSRRVNTQVSEHGHTPLLPKYKRQLNGTNGYPISKRQKLLHDDDDPVKLNGNSGSENIGDDANGAILVCVSFSKLVSNIRNKYLTHRAVKSTNSLCGQVLQQALSHLQVTEEWTHASEDVYLDIQNLQEDVNYSQNHHLPNGNQQNGSVTTNGVHTYDEMDDNIITYNQVDRSLALLADSDFDFIHGAYGQEWMISKSGTDSFIRRQEIMRIMGGRLGAPSMRIIRMLADKGKLDEKTLQEVGLLGAKDLRQTLAHLKDAGYIDLQEVPRESQRQPNRTIFLWFHDSDRVQKILIDELYKSMTRLLQRLKVERRKLASTLEKTERSDVHGNEETIMSAAELRVLRRWQRTEQWILGEVARLDRSIALLRDL